jgi:predicted acyltransferase
VSPWLPLIKRIWTPSFAVFAGGWTVLFLAFFYLVIEIGGRRRWAFPLVVVGMNSIAAYVIAGAFGNWFARLTGVWVRWLWEHTLAGRLDEAAWFPVFQRLLFVAFAWYVLYWFWRRRIFFKC